MLRLLCLDALDFLLDFGRFVFLEGVVVAKEGRGEKERRCEVDEWRGDEADCRERWGRVVQSDGSRSSYQRSIRMSFPL